MTKIFKTASDAVGLTDSKAGERAAAAQREAASTQAGFQREALDFLKQEQAPISAARQGSLARLSALAGGYGVPSEAELLQNIEQNPLYQAILGTQEGAERAVLRNQAATGGFRGGDTQVGLGRVAADTQRNALLAAFQNRQAQNQQGFQNRLALEGQILGQPTQTSNIAALTSGIGQTLAQGQTAAAQSALQGSQSNTANLLNILGTAAAFSDRRLKDDIKFAGTQNGYKVYTWRWNNKAKKLGLEGVGHGVIADEVKKKKPEAVKTYMGFDTVDYEMIGVKHG